MGDNNMTPADVAAVMGNRGYGYGGYGDVRDELIRLMSKTNDDREIQAIEAAIEQIERQ